ncbi:hypothetical protein VTN96DRAFT_6464 [Rasamsonia emersonii]
MPDQERVSELCKRVAALSQYCKNPINNTRGNNQDLKRQSGRGAACTPIGQAAALVTAGDAAGTGIMGLGPSPELAGLHARHCAWLPRHAKRSILLLAYDAAVKLLLQCQLSYPSTGVRSPGTWPAQDVHFRTLIGCVRPPQP